MIDDQYEALRTDRPYKPAMNYGGVFRIITVGTNRTRPEHFAPDVLDAFVKLAPEFDKAYQIHNPPLYLNKKFIDL